MKKYISPSIIQEGVWGHNLLVSSCENNSHKNTKQPITNPYERLILEYFKSDSSDEVGTVETFKCPVNDDYFVIGKKVTIQEDLGLLYYIAPLAHHEAILFVCLDEDNAEKGLIMNAFNDYDEYDLNILKPSFPKLMNAIIDGFHDNYTNYALIKLNYHEISYDCLATKISNIDFADLDTQYIFEKALDCSRCFMDMLDEMDEGEVTFAQKAKLAAHSILPNVQTGLSIKRLSDFLFG